VSDALDQDHIQISRSSEHRYSKVRVIGNRIVCCCSIGGADLVGGGTLVPKWETAEATAYIAGTGTPADPTEEHDKARTAERFRPVFQAFGMPVSQNMDAFAVKTSALGVPVYTDVDWQNKVRKTLNWLPLREGFDYSTNPATNNNPTDYEPEFLPPMAWVYDDELARNIAADAAGIHVSVSRTDWGVWLQSTPNHLLAKGHDTGIDSEDESKYDYELSVATIAFETDHRLTLEQDTGEGGGETLVIHDSTAECWVALDDTILDIGVDGAVKRVPGNIVLRNDSDRLQLLLAGALARYRMGRGRAVLSIRGQQDWQQYIGHILTVVDEAGDTQPMACPVTGVEWVDDPAGPRTIIKCGFAS
jgi:hypothetical protein